jgi:hypothetical protein
MSPALRKLLGGAELRGLTAAQRLALAEVLETYDVDAPEARQLIAHITGRPDLAPSPAEWARARARRERAELFGLLADRLEGQAGGVSPEGLARLRRRLRRANPKPANDD